MGHYRRQPHGGVGRRGNDWHRAGESIDATASETLEAFPHYRTSLSKHPLADGRITLTKTAHKKDAGRALAHPASFILCAEI
jgi:hypothetical protein